MKTEKKLTALQELFICFPLSEEVKNVYLEKEKQQIIDAYKDGVTGTLLSEQYYEQTYKNY